MMPGTNRSPSGYRTTFIRRGFSIAELLVSLGLFGVIFVCLVQIILAGHFAIRQGDEAVIATNTAKMVMERIRQMNYDEIPHDANYEGRNPHYHSYNPLYPPKPYPSVTVNGVTYFINVHTTTEEMNILGKPQRLRHVDVTVEWDSRDAFSIQLGGNAGTFKRSLTLSNIVINW